MKLARWNPLSALRVACRIPVAERPQMILDAEEDLGITAGLQDRVAQVSLQLPNVPAAGS